MNSKPVIRGLYSSSSDDSLFKDPRPRYFAQQWSFEFATITGSTRCWSVTLRYVIR